METRPAEAHQPVIEPSPVSCAGGGGHPVLIIPAYNAQATIGPLVRRLKALQVEVVVVSDGSTDRTACEAIDAGAVVISHFHHDGTGAALRLGFSYALERGYDPVVTMDSNGWHDPDDLLKLLSAARQAPQPIVGQRVSDDERLPHLRRWANRIMSVIVSLVRRRHRPDAPCGFRVIRRQALLALRAPS